MSLRLRRFKSADHSSGLRLKDLLLRLNLSLKISSQHFWRKTSTAANWPSGGVHLDLRLLSFWKTSLSEEPLKLLLSWKNALSCTRRRNFSRSCLTKNSSVLLAIGAKLRPLVRTDFSGSDGGKLLGIVTTASWLSSGGSRLLEAPTRLVNFCVLICCRNWKSLELSC